MKVKTQNKLNRPLIAGLLALIAVIGFFIFLRYQKEEPIRCTLEARAGLVLKLIDETGAEINGAAIRADDETSSFDEFNGQYMGLYENPGTHVVTIEKPGFKPITITVNLKKNVCHVNSEQQTITLQK